MCKASKGIRHKLSTNARRRSFVRPALQRALFNYKPRTVVMAGLLPHQVLRSTLRSVGCPVCCLPPRLLRLQVGPLPSLRTFVRRPLSTVTVRAQRSGLAEGKRAALAASFAELGLGQDLLTFLAESRLGSPTEIQVRRCTARQCLYSACLTLPYASAHSIMSFGLAGLQRCIVKQDIAGWLQG